MASFMDTAGRPLWLNDNQFSNMTTGVPSNFMGKEVILDNFVPTPAASSYSVIYGDVSGYYAPQRVGMSIRVAEEILIRQDLVVVIARMRFGGQLVHDWQVKTMQCA